jgi:Copper binding periplasmic protein CusF
MNLARLMLAGAMLAAVPSMTLAQQSLTGTITRIDRLDGGGATDQQFKAPSPLLDNVHAGDRIGFTVSETGGNKTITKIDKQ